MKLLTAQQIRQWDQYTIQHEPVKSIQLMERAAKACTKWLLQNTLSEEYYIFCGKGNNGGDGLAIARLLSDSKREVKVFILESDAKGSEDYLTNFNYLHQGGKVPITLIRSENDYPSPPPNAIIIDALFGTGLYKNLLGNAAALVNYLNQTGNVVISVDMPSGMLCDESSHGNAVVKAAHTLTFQCLKMAFLVAENEPYFGQVHILDINLHPDYPEQVKTTYSLINKSRCQSIFKSRRVFAHKGDFGHALIVAGSYGKMGAAVLSAKACMHSGVGLLTCHVPAKGVGILQTSVPEAMCQADEAKKWVSFIEGNLSQYSGVGIGPGIGTEEPQSGLVNELLKKSNKPIIIDADALNILAQHNDWLSHIPPGSILTPHPKEFARLFGEGKNDFEKIDTALEKAMELQVIILLKGHNSFIALPDGSGYFNITGNAGMATGGSGDVLTGILTGLLAQGYSPGDSAIFGVFLHGLAGDFAAGKYSMEAMIASDIIKELSFAFLEITNS